MLNFTTKFLRTIETVTEMCCAPQGNRVLDLGGIYILDVLVHVVSLYIFMSCAGNPLQSV